MKAALVPQTYAELERWSQRVASTDFVPKEYRNKPNDVLICAQYAQELGLGIIEGLRSIAVINGKPSVYGDGLLALCMSSPVCEYIRETPLLDDGGNIYGYVCEAKRHGQDAKVTRFTYDDAKRAKLATKLGPWQEYPQRMLQMRARGFALRDAFPDVLKGLITREEAQDYPPEAVIDMPAGPMTITDAQVEEIKQLLDALGPTAEEVALLLERYHAATIPDIKAEDYARLVNGLISRKRRKEEESNG